MAIRQPSNHCLSRTLAFHYAPRYHPTREFNFILINTETKEQNVTGDSYVFK